MDSFENQEITQAILLTNNNTDTRWFHDYVWQKAVAVCFWRGRLKFSGADSGAPFPNAVAYYGPCPFLFETAFASAGKVVRL